MSLQQYVIHPRKTRDGFNLVGPLLPFGIWHTSEENALGHVQWICRELGGSVWVVDSKGYPIVTETIAAREPHLLGG